ncbi:hypothetical protein GWI33_017887 [Rhynchophorus ferrugineus]|uniref:Uncharacterized protein n=1 Tax=Rhynchophorus ferrugineus TaxID=354439 RepID=A0A834HXN9_RHYFE|nr:hypothetical protein GWI33_017887 [Rhynchophorus ferrugineus]
MFRDVSGGAVATRGRGSMMSERESDLARDGVRDRGDRGSGARVERGPGGGRGLRMIFMLSGNVPVVLLLQKKLEENFRKRRNCT